MGKLYGSTCYLIGAMDRVPDGGIEWREWITPKLHKLGTMVFNPCNKPVNDPRLRESPEDRERRKIAKERCDYSVLEEGREIRNIDLEMVDHSSYIICNLDIDVHACGTYEELFWANRCKKPVLVHCNQGKKMAPDWLFWTLPHQHIFSNWDDLFAHLEYVNVKGNDETDRWTIFDMSKEIEAIRKYKIEQEIS